MAIAFDKANVNVQEGVSAATSTVTVPAGGVAAGELVVVAGAHWDGTITLSSVADSRGNTYSTPITKVSGADVSCGTAYCVITTALQAADTITLTWSVDSFMDVISGFVSYSGIAAGVALDQHNEGAGTGTTLASGNITTTQADELLLGIGALADNTTWTKTAAFTNKRVDATATDFLALLVEDLIVSSTGTYASGPTSSNSDLWASMILSFEAAAAAGDTTTRRYQIRRSRMTSW
jgi:hypothetical protein